MSESLGGPGGPRRSPVMSALPWVLGSLLVLIAALVAGLGTAYLVGSLRQVPPPQSLITPTPAPTPRPTASPAPTAASSPTLGPVVSPTPSLVPTPEVTPLVHVVQPGESISLIAVQYGTTVDAIVDLNGLQNPNLIVPGQELLIPAPDDGAEEEDEDP